MGTSHPISLLPCPQFKKENPQRLELAWADGSYAGKLIGWVKQECGWVLEIVKRSDDTKGFKLLPRRWVVERTFAWLGRFRRMSKDYDFTPPPTRAKADVHADL